MVELAVRSWIRFFLRRCLASFRRNLIDRRVFERNAKRIDEAEGCQEELIDVMPGIGIPMVIHPKMYFRAAYTEEVFEPSCLYYIRDCLVRGQTFLDVGSNIGYFSLFASKIVGSSGRVIAFEPGEFQFNLLSKNKDLNHIPWLEIYQAGLGLKNATASFNCGQPGMDVYSSIGEIKHPNACLNMFQNVDIQIFCGDDWARNHDLSHIDLMKVDVEGGEYDVLKGMKGMFEFQKVHRLLIELTHGMSAAFNYAPGEVISFLYDLGYRWFRLEAFGRLNAIEKNSSVRDGMFVAVPEGGPVR